MENKKHMTYTFLTKQPIYNVISFLSGICIIAFIVGAFLLLQCAIHADRCTEVVNATVVDNISEYKDEIYNTVDYKKSVLSYSYNGEEYQVKAKAAYDPPLYNSGDTVELKINPSNPSDYYNPDEKWEKYFGIALCLLSGVYLIFVAKFVPRDSEEE